MIAARDERRRQGLDVLIRRLGVAGDARLEDAGRALLALTSFESFDTLAGPDRDLDAAIPLVTARAEAALRNLVPPGSGGG